MSSDHSIDSVLHAAAFTLDPEKDLELNQPSVPQTWGEFKERLRRRQKEGCPRLTPFKTELDITKDGRSR